MAITLSHLTEKFDTANLSAYTVGPIQPTANSLVVVVASGRSGGASLGEPAVSGNGITYSLVTSENRNANNVRTSVFVGTAAAPSSSVLTVNWSPDNCTNAGIIVSEFAGVDITGGAAAAIVQSVRSSVAASRITLTLASFSSTANATFGGAGKNANSATTAGSNFTVIAQKQGTSGTGNAGAIGSCWTHVNQTTVDMYWASTVAGNGIAMELLASAPATYVPSPYYQFYRSRVVNDAD